MAKKDRLSDSYVKQEHRHRWNVLLLKIGVGLLAVAALVAVAIVMN